MKAAINRVMESILEMMERYGEALRHFPYL